MIGTFDKLEPSSSEHIKITDALFDGVEVRVFEPSPKQDETLKRSVVYIHGGGWALASASMCLSLIRVDLICSHHSRFSVTKSCSPTQKLRVLLSETCLNLMRAGTLGL